MFTKINNAHMCQMLKLPVFGCVLACGSMFAAQNAGAELRVVTYNVAGLDGNQSSLTSVFSALNDDPAPQTGRIHVPDIYIFQEVTSSDVSWLVGTIRNAAPSDVSYSVATFTTNGGGGENALIYRSDVLDEDAGNHIDITNHTGPRATDRWKLTLLEDGSVIYVYGSHFKADTGSTNQSKRESEANAIRNNADALGQGTFIMYCGDYNLYTPSEAAFQRFLDPGNGQAVDPWFDGSFSNAISHTQSPHDGSEGLVMGGMDDRFDFLLSTGEFNDSTGMETVAPSYRTFGNDGLHYNVPINSGFNAYFSSADQWKADALARASDHLPVVVDYTLANPAFSLEADPLVAGSQATLYIENGTPLSTVYFVYSTAGLGEFEVGSLNTTLRLSNPQLLSSRTTSPDGSVSMPVNVPGGFSGVEAWLQAVQQGRATDPVYRLVQ